MDKRARKSAYDLLYQAMASYTNDLSRALALADEAQAADPESLLARYVHRALPVLDLSADIFDDPAPFRQFVESATNRLVYDRVVDFLAEKYREWHPTTLLDIGTGDGEVLAQSLERSGITIGGLDAIEPSDELAELARARLEAWAQSHGGGTPQPHVHTTTAQAFSESPKGGSRWDAAQAVFSVQFIRPEERSDVFHWLARSVTHFTLVEFGVPDFKDDLGPDRFAYCAQRFEVGLTEHPEGSPAIEGFLIPLFCKWFVKGERTSWENSAGSWVRWLTEAGFVTSTTTLSEYWWAPAVAIVGALKS